jgi:hypothetical protein
MQIDLPERTLPWPGGDELLGVLTRISDAEAPNPKNQIPRKVPKIKPRKWSFAANLF